MSIDTYKNSYEEIKNTLEVEINRHLSLDNIWYPHDYIPWDEGRNYSMLDGKDWDNSDIKLNDFIKESLIIGLISEDNLPNYFYKSLTATTTTISKETMGLWQEWFKLWAAEEGRHSIALRDYLIVTRNADPKQIEDERMNVIKNGWDNPYPGYGDPYIEILYPSIQELATRIFHKNVGMLSNDSRLEKMMTRLSKDENNHMIFYRNIFEALLEVDQNTAIISAVKGITTFQMPGSNVIKNYYPRAMKIALGGIYDLRQHKDNVLIPLIKYWKLFDKKNLNSNSEKALEELDKFLINLEIMAADFEERREEYLISLQNK